MAIHRGVACLLVLLVTTIAEVPTHSAARFMTVDGMTHTDSAGMAVDMIPYHHYTKANLTLLERAEIAVKSSLARGKYFHDVIYGETSEFSDKAVFQTPLYSGQGSYIIQIRIGTPVKTFVAIADTGSDLVWIQCATCQRCFSEPDPVFQPSQSSSYRTLPCTGNAFCAATGTSQPCSASRTCIYTYGYGDGSTTAGDLASETLTLTTTGGTTQGIPNFAFGCGHNNQGTFGNVDGLVGLGQGPLSLTSQIGSQIGNVFSYCLTDIYSTSSKTSTLLLGSPGPVALTYTSLVTNNANPTFYYVTVTGITVNGVAVSYPAAAFQITSNGQGGVILDSGTTLTLLDSRAYTPVKNKLQSLITYPRIDYSAYGYDLCYRPGVSTPTFPAVSFQFPNVNMALPSPNVFFQVTNVDWCLAWQSSNFGLSIIGNIQQQNFQVAYDRANKRVGFARRTC